MVGQSRMEVFLRAFTEVKNIVTFVVKLNSINNKHSTVIKSGNCILKYYIHF